MEHVLHHKDGNVRVETGDGSTKQSRVVVELESSRFMLYDHCETGYPLELIQQILDVKGPTGLVDEILREESSAYVERILRYGLFAYVEPKAFQNKRLLDFGCGSGASTMVLSRMLPETKITAVDLNQGFLKIAEMRASHYGVVDRIRFSCSPDGSVMPSDVGEFDFVCMSGVYEHLLPEERPPIMVQLWQCLKPSGILFLSQTPNRWFPIESHTTGGLPLLNYMPPWLAVRYACFASRRIPRTDDWPTLLRKGICGGSVREIMRLLKSNEYRPIQLTPTQLGLKDRIDLWYALSSHSRLPAIKKVLRGLFRLAKISTGIVFLPTLTLGFQKTEDKQTTQAASR